MMLYTMKYNLPPRCNCCDGQPVMVVISNTPLRPVLPSQDEVNEMKEREVQAKIDAENAARMKAEEDKMRAANLDGIETLADDMVCST